jgi:membrane-associated HD superfamily phosphohydrolase
MSVLKFSQNSKKFLTLSSVVLISFFLLIAVYGKLFYPNERLKQVDLLACSIEITLIIFLCIFHMRYAMWLIAALLFSSWAGYAFYWYYLKLPCNCAGSVITFSSAFALLLDVLFGASIGLMYLTLLCACLFFLLGYVFADWVFHTKILEMSWNIIISP